MNDLHENLLAIPSEELVPPHVDPRTAALVALGVVDFVRYEGKDRFAELAAVDGVDLDAFDDLARLADALVRVVDVFEEAPRTPKPVVIPPDLDGECRQKRSAMQSALSSFQDPAIVRTLQRQKLSYGPIDLAIDLRSSSALLVRYAPAMTGLADSARALANELETHLWAHDTPELRQARAALHRVWTAFEPAYHGLAELARELFADADDLFPTLETIADVERHARHESSSKQHAAELVEAELPPSRRNGPASRRVRSTPPLVDVPRALVEVVLHAHSEANVWLGFSQDIAEGGVFVASYVTHPLGARVDLELHVDREEPVHVSGVVSWLRPHTAGDDLPPGYGVRLTDASHEAAKLLTRFASRRTPIFYDD